MGEVVQYAEMVKRRANKQGGRDFTPAAAVRKEKRRNEITARLREINNEVVQQEEIIYVGGTVLLREGAAIKRLALLMEAAKLRDEYME
jgi:hypothetical protein